MVRVTMIMLCFLLAAAAAGRYQAEVSVRDARRHIQDLDNATAKEISEIQVLRAEIAYLESPDRLADIAERVTDLEPLNGGQLMTADEFLLAFEEAVETPDATANAASVAPAVPVKSVETPRALAMADIKLAE